MRNKSRLAVAAVIGLAVAAVAAPLTISAVNRLVLKSGASQAYTVSVNSSGQLVVLENLNVKAPVITVDDGNGTMILRSRTSAQIAAMTPTVAGELIFNSSVVGLCVSSGTTGSAYVYISSYTTATSGVRVPCY